MALEDLFPGRRTLEQERFLDTLFHHAGFWYATEVAGTEEAFVRDGFSRRKQAPRSSPLDRIAALFERRSNQPDHEHYADPGFQMVSSRVLNPQYTLPNPDSVDFSLSQDEMVTGNGFKTTPTQRYTRTPSSAILLDGGNQDPVIEFILSTARQDQTLDGQYRFSSFGLVVPASEAPIVQAFVQQDPTLLDHVKREMFPAWEAQYPTVPVGAGAHTRPEPHTHRAQPQVSRRDPRIVDITARLDRVNARIAEMSARFSQPFDFDAIYNTAYAAAGAGAPATVAVPRYERPEPRRAPEAPRPAPEPRTEPYVQAPPAPRPVPQPEVPPDLWADKTAYEPPRPAPAPRSVPAVPRAPEPRAPYTPSPAEAQRRADYLASLRRPEPETPRAPEPEAPTQTYVAPQPSAERVRVIEDAREAVRQREEYLVALLRQRQPGAPPSTPEPTPAPIPQVQAPLDDTLYARARELVDKLGVQPSASLFHRRLDLSYNNAALLVERFRDEAYEASRTPSTPVAPAPPAPTVSGEYQAVTPSMFELPAVDGAPPPATLDEALERARDAQDIMERLVPPPVPVREDLLSSEESDRIFTDYRFAEPTPAPVPLPSRLDALADELFPEPVPAPLRDVPLSSLRPSIGVAQKVYHYTLKVDDVNPHSGDFPGTTYTIIREGDRVRFENDVLGAIEARLLGAVDLHLGLEHGSPFAQYTEQGGPPQYRYSELVRELLGYEPRPTADFLQDLFFASYLGLEPDAAKIYAHHHLFVAGMPQSPTSRMGTEQLAILGRVVKVEELPPDYKAPNLGEAVGALQTYTTPPDEDRTPTLTPPPESEPVSSFFSDEELAQLFSAYDTARETQVVPPPIPLIDPRAETDPSLPTATYGASVPAHEDRSITGPVTPRVIVPRVQPAPDAPKPATLDDALETIFDDLRGYGKLEYGSLRTAAQLQDERRTHPDLLEQEKLKANWFYTADGNGYFPVDGDVEWAITAEEHNLVLRHLNDEVNSSYDQLLNICNFRPENDEAQAAKSAEGTLVTRMSRLRLSGTDRGSYEWKYLAIRTKDGCIKTEAGYEAPNEDEKRVMDQLGYTSENLAMLRTSPQKIQETKIYVLNPAYVQEKVAEDPAYNSVWQASRLSSFSSSSNFFADDRGVDSHDALRGVRRRVAEGDAPKHAVTEPVTPSIVIPRVEPAPDASKPASLDETIARRARPRGHSVVHYTHAVPSSPGGPGYFGGAAAHDTEVTELGTQDVLSAEEVGAEVARRQAEPSVDAEALFNEGVRLIRIGNIGTGLRSLTDAYQANPIYIDRGLRFAMKQIREGSSEGISSEGVNSILSILDDIIGVDPTYALAFVGRSFIYSKQAEINDYAPFLRQSLGDIDYACQLDPANATFQQQREGIQKQALTYVAEHATVYGANQVIPRFLAVSHALLGKFIVSGSQLNRYEPSEQIVGGLAVKGWTEKGRERNIKDLIGNLDDHLKDPATPLMDYQSFVSHRAEMTGKGKSFNPEPQKGQYLIVTVEDEKSIRLHTRGCVQSIETAENYKGTKRDQWVQDVENTLIKGYGSLGAVPLVKLLQSL